MSDYKEPIQPEEIDWLRDDIYIGQTVNVLRSDPMWEHGKRKRKAMVIEKHKHFIVCEYVRSGIKECFTYVQILLGDGVWLV